MCFMQTIRNDVKLMKNKKRVVSMLNATKLPKREKLILKQTYKLAKKGYKINGYHKLLLLNTTTFVGRRKANKVLEKTLKRSYKIALRGGAK